MVAGVRHIGWEWHRVGWGACFKLGNGLLCGFPLTAPWDLCFQGAMNGLYWSEMGSGFLERTLSACAMSITNNRASFYLWWKENLVKPQKVSNYYENGCTVKPVYSGHLWFLKKMSAITRCPLYRVLDFLGKKRHHKLRFFSYNTSKQYK